ncbi:unnamed protein product [Arabidopsis halleri]
MKREYGIDPGIEHYGYMLDPIGRTGNFSAAKRFIEEMPLVPTALELGIVKLEDVNRIKLLMESKGISRTSSRSTVETKSKSHVSTNGDRSHVSQFLSCPTDIHMEAAYKVLRYIKNNPGQEVDYRYESFLDSMDQDEKREHLLDIMLCERIANHDPQPEDPDIPYAEEFEYVSHGVYVSIPHPPLDILDHPSPYLFRVRGAFLYNEDGTTMCTIPKHYFESILARGDPGS